VLFKCTHCFTFLGRSNSILLGNARRYVYRTVVGSVKKTKPVRGSFVNARIILKRIVRWKNVNWIYLTVDPNRWGTLIHTNNINLSCSTQCSTAVSATWTATNCSRRTAWFGCLGSVGNMATVWYLTHVGRWPWTTVPIAMCDVLTGNTANICMELQVTSSHRLSLNSQNVFLCLATLCTFCSCFFIVLLVISKFHLQVYLQ